MKYRQTPEPTELRAQAERPAASRQEPSSAAQQGDISSLVHELQVYQTELEMQNEELRSARHDLEQSRAHYRTLFHHAPTGYLVLTREGIVVEANHTFVHMIGRESGQILHCPFADLVAPEDRAHFRSRLRAFFNAPENRALELRLISADHEKQLHVLLSGSSTPPNHFGLAARDDTMLVTVADISERITHERSLRKSREFVLSIIDSLPAHLCVLDRDGKIIMVNEAWRRFSILNGAPDQLLCEGADYLLVCDNATGDGVEDAHQFGTAIRAVLSEQLETFSLEYPCHTPDAKRWFNGTITRLSGDRENGCIVTVHEDITIRRHLEQQRSVLASQVSKMAKTASLKQLASAVSHKFNTVLAAILGNLEMALDHVPRDGKAAIHLNTSLQAAWRATELSGQILTYLGRTTEDKHVFSLTEICRETLLAAQRSAPALPVVTTELPAEPVPVCVDLKQIQQILRNLLDNAGEAIAEQEAGQVRLTITIADQQHFAGQRFYPADWVPHQQHYACLAISDNGCGIDALQLDSIFDPFFSTKQTGRGMGLAIVLGILKIHDGGITIDSKPGGGTTFTVYLPLSPLTGSHSEQ